MDNIEQIERRLWEAADQLRANSKLTSTEYSLPILGLIFLRHAYNRFLIVEKEIKKDLPSRGGQTRSLTKEDFIQKSSLYLQEEAQFKYLLELPSGEDIARKIITAMELIESDYKGLEGILPKDYHIFDNELLSKMLRIFNDENRGLPEPFYTISDVEHKADTVFNHVFMQYQDSQHNAYA